MGKKILIINLHSSRNAGDAALLQASIQQLQGAFPKGQITLAINDTRSVAAMRDNNGGVKVLSSFMALFGPNDKRSRWNIPRMASTLGISFLSAFWYRLIGQLPCWMPDQLRDLLCAYVDADLIVSCPGNVFFTMGRWGLPFFVSAYTVAYALFIGKPLYVMPQSIGPLKRGWERFVVQYLYSKARLVFVREPISFRLFQDLGLTDNRYHLVPDVAFGVLPAASKNDLSLLEIMDTLQPKIGVTVINKIVHEIGDVKWEQYASSVASVLTKFLATYGGSVFFCPQVIGPTKIEDDRVMARHIREQMPPYASVHLLDMPTSPESLMVLYRGMDVFLATRMHSGIFAMNMNVPTIFIGYLYKTRGLVEMLGMQDWYLDIQEVTEDSLWELVERLWLQRGLVRDKLTRVVPPLRQRSNQVGEMIAEDYYNYEA